MATTIWLIIGFGIIVALFLIGAPLWSAFLAGSAVLLTMAIGLLALYGTAHASAEIFRFGGVRLKDSVNTALHVQTETDRLRISDIIIRSELAMIEGNKRKSRAHGDKDRHDHEHDDCFCLRHLGLGADFFR